MKLERFRHINILKFKGKTGIWTPGFSHTSALIPSFARISAAFKIQKLCWNEWLEPETVACYTFSMQHLIWSTKSDQFLVFDEIQNTEADHVLQKKD